MIGKQRPMVALCSVCRCRVQRYGYDRPWVHRDGPADHSAVPALLR